MGTANLTTMPRLVCIQVAILMLAMSFALAESNSAPDSGCAAGKGCPTPTPDWAGGCKKPLTCPKECKSGDASHTFCKKYCAHKWEYTSNKGPYQCKDKKKCKDSKEYEFKDELFWCPPEVQTNPAKALLSIGDNKGDKFEVKKVLDKNFRRRSPQYEICKPKNYGKNGETTPVRLKFLENEAHRKYKTDSKEFMAHEAARNVKTNWSKRGYGIEMYPWVTPGVSNCAPEAATKYPADDFIKYFEALKTDHGHVKDKIGADCYKISRRKVKGISTAEKLHKAGRCKFNIAGRCKMDGKTVNPCRYCVTEDSFFCAKATTKTTEVYEKVRVDKMKNKGRGKDKRKDKSKYFFVKLDVTFSTRKANMCERMWRHLPYTCSVYKVTDPPKVVVKSCSAYDGGSKFHNSGPPPKELCDHFKKYYPRGNQQSQPNPKEIPDFKGSVSIPSWKGFKRSAPTILPVAALEAAGRAFVSMK